MVSHKAKGYWFDSWSRHRPGLWARSSAGVCERQPIHVSLIIDVSLPVSKNKNKINIYKYEKKNIDILKLVSKLATLLKGTF